jgi:hypothetical protein
MTRHDHQQRQQRSIDGDEDDELALTGHEGDQRELATKVHRFRTEATMAAVPAVKGRASLPAMATAHRDNSAISA